MYFNSSEFRINDVGIPLRFEDRVLDRNTLHPLAFEKNAVNAKLNIAL